MLHITILAVGKLKEAYMQAAAADYATRLSRYCRLDIIEVPEDLTVEKEGTQLLRRLPEQACCIALDLDGKQMTSPQLASVLEKLPVEGISHIVCVIGGSDGLDKRICRRARIRLCLSEMTFPHQMARLILLEQLYRAMKIINGEKYHK